MTIEFKGLEQLIRDCIKSELQNFKPVQVLPPKQAQFISRKKAASILGISLPTLANYCQKGTIPSYRMGSRVLLKEEEVVSAVSQVKTYTQYKEDLAKLTNNKTIS